VNPQRLRAFLYQEIIERNRWPTLAAIASNFQVDVAQARTALGDLKIGKSALVNPQTGELWMAGPFSDRETPYRVHANAKSWCANCAWDMLGVVALVGAGARVEARCTDCSEPMSFDVDPVRGPAAGDGGVVHFLVPAGRWYDDIAYT
jgi:hypothetical protein